MTDILQERNIEHSFSESRDILITRVESTHHRTGRWSSLAMIPGLGLANPSSLARLQGIPGSNPGRPTMLLFVTDKSLHAKL